MQTLCVFKSVPWKRGPLLVAFRTGPIQQAACRPLHSGMHVGGELLLRAAVWTPQWDDRFPAWGIKFQESAEIFEDWKTGSAKPPSRLAADYLLVREELLTRCAMPCPMFPFPSRNPVSLFPRCGTDCLSNIEHI
jgi:hypothetical protein